jgi:hypothetical protein
MQLPSPADAAGRVTAALRNAAQATGAGFDYLLRTAKRESSLDPSAKAPTSSASGLFQFVDQTWLEVLKEEGPKLGLAAEAADVTRTASGRYAVGDPDRRTELLALRNDPKTAALLAGAFTRRNAAALNSGLGRAPTEGELYAAHFLGAQGAVDLVKLASSKPDAAAADLFAAQASANRAIFFDRGRARSASEVYAKLTAISGSSGAASVSAPALALQQVSGGEDIGPFRNGAGENDAQPFHSLFQTGRRSPVSAYVTQAWSSFAPAGLAADVGSQANQRVAGAHADVLRRQTQVQPTAVVAAAAAQSSPAGDQARAKPNAAAKAKAVRAAAPAPAALASASATAGPAAGKHARSASEPLDLQSFRRPDLPPVPVSLTRSVRR